MPPRRRRADQERADLGEREDQPRLLGRQTANIWRASQGGQAFKGEAPQADQLLPIAQQKNVKLVLLNITANDLGFSDHVIDCTVAWTLG